MNRSRFLALFGLLPLVLVAGDLTYIVHWTSEEPCHECDFTVAVICAASNSGCCTPMKTVGHFEIAVSKDAAVLIANEIGEPKTSGAMQSWGSGTISGGIGTPPKTPRAKGAIVAIYEARPLKIQVKEQVISTPQPPAVAKKAIVSLP